MKPRLLFLAQCLPYPPHSGVTNRTFNILRQIAVGFDTTLVAFTRRNHQRTSQEVSAAQVAIQELGVHVAEAFPIRSERSTLARLIVHGTSLLSGRPYTWLDYWGRKVPRVLRSALAEARPSVVHMDSLDLYRLLPFTEGVPVACTHHSIESELLRLRARHVGSSLLRWYLARQAAAVESVERTLCGRLALNVMMSDVDGARLRVLVPGARTLTVPNGVDVDSFRPDPAVGEIEGRVAFLGPSYMFPNRDGVDWFLESMWPAIRGGEPNATFEVIGKVMPDHASRWGSVPGVSCAGYVPDIRPHLAQAACCVVPLRVGGGTRLKILDAWAMGRAVVSTSVGCEGLAAVDGENILIRDTPEAFAQAILDLLADPEARTRLGQGARATAVRLYSWDAIGARLRERYTSLAETDYRAGAEA